jgi:hypothetical protein
LAASGGVLLTRIRRIVGVQAVMHDTLPRTGGWPVALVLAASLLAVLRLHGLPSLATTLLRVPVASTAAITGNTALLNSAPAVAPASVASAPARDSAADESAAVNSAIAVTPTHRRRIGRACAAAVTNIREHLSPLPSVPEPAAVTEPSNANLAPRVAAIAEPAKSAAVAMPIPLQRVQPDYPVREKIRGVTGKVELQFGWPRTAASSTSTCSNRRRNMSSTARRSPRSSSGVLPRRSIPASATRRLSPSPTAPRPPAPSRAARSSGHICRHVAGDDTER